MGTDSMIFNDKIKEILAGKDKKLEKNKVYCKKCRTENLEIANFCQECGHTLIKPQKYGKADNKKEKKKQKDLEKKKKRELKEERKKQKELEKFLKNIDYYEKSVDNVHDFNHPQRISTFDSNRQYKKKLEYWKQQEYARQYFFEAIWEFKDELNTDENLIIDLNLMNDIDLFIKKNLEDYGTMLQGHWRNNNLFGVLVDGHLLSNFIDLQELLKLKGVDLSYKNLLLIIYERIEQVGYESLKEDISEFNSDIPNTLKDNIRIFVELFEKEYYRYKDCNTLGCFENNGFFLFNKKIFIDLLNEKGIQCNEEVFDKELSDLKKEKTILDLEAKLLD